MILYCPFFVPKGYRSITLFPFIFLVNRADASDEVLINHENIHLRQQIEMLVIPFYICYLAEYGIRYLEYKNVRKAYRSISFEKEAYANEMQRHYLKHRRFWSFLSYF